MDQVSTAQGGRGGGHAAVADHTPSDAVAWDRLRERLASGAPVFAWHERGRLHLAEGRVVPFTAGPRTGPWVGWPGPLPERWTPPVVEDATTWQARVAAAEAACRAGQLTKVVPARVAALLPPAGQRYDVAATFQALCARQAGEVAFVVGGGGRWFVGASPEVLVRVEGGRLRTHALAGTRRWPGPEGEAAAVAELLASDKDRREHQAVVDDLCIRLAPLCDSLDAAPHPRVRRLPELLHLETPIEGTLRAEVTIDEVVARLHPTPALGGAPREAALAWLAEHEPFDRGSYGAPLGHATSPRDGVFWVGIRSALVLPEVAWAFVGAGVVAGTAPAAEWAETEAKLATVARCLRTAPVDGPQEGHA